MFSLQFLKSDLGDVQIFSSWITPWVFVVQLLSRTILLSILFILNIEEPQSSVVRNVALNSVRSLRRCRLRMHDWGRFLRTNSTFVLSDVLLYAFLAIKSPSCTTQERCLQLNWYIFLILAVAASASCFFKTFQIESCRSLLMFLSMDGHGIGTSGTIVGTRSGYFALPTKRTIFLVRKEAVL